LQLKKPNKIEKTRFKTILYYLKDKNTRREKATRDSIIAGRKLIQEKRKQNTRKDDKKFLIGGQENGTVSASTKKRRNKRKYRYCCNSIADTNKNNLTQELRY
jgi:hypothetical protein